MYQKTGLSEGHTPLLAVIMCIIGITAMALDDWHFYGKNIALHNRAIQQPATYCDPDSYHKCYPASLAVDGDTHGYFKHGSCSHTIGKASVDASWTVYFDNPFNVTGIVIYNRDDVKIRLKDFMIYGDGHILIHNSAGTEEYNKNILSFTIDGLRSFSTITVLLPKQHGYSGGGNYYLTLCEVEIYAAPRPACDAPATETNVKNGQTKVYSNTGRLINHQYTVGTIIDVVCNNSFHVNGSSRFQCLATGRYDIPIPRCIEACLPILKPSNGHVVPGRLLYPVNTSLKIICDVGYETQEADLIHCQTGGKWENPIPTCQLVHCSLPKTPDHGYYSVNGHTEIDNFFYSNMPYMSEIIGLCNTGYVSNHFQRRICKSDKTWSDTETICTPIQCPHPRNVTNAVYSFKNGSKIRSGSTFDYNTVLEASCQVGYIVLGQRDRTCQSNKTWTGKDPHCSVETCDFPGQFENGHYVIKNNNITDNNTLASYLTGRLDFSSEIEAVCDQMYILNSTSSIRKCNATGIWDGQSPTCVPVICPWPVPLDNGIYQASNNVTQLGMPYNTTLKAICNEMYKLSRAQSYISRRCNENAVWDKEPAVCEPLCALPSMDNGAFLNVMSSRFEIGTTLTFTCETGFAAAGSTDTIVCQDNHQWSAKPKCQIRQNPSQPTDTSIPESFCKLPNVANGKLINVVSTHFELGSTLRFKCDTGFTASESCDTVTCQGNHQWSAEPICQDNSNASRSNAVSASMIAVYVCLSIFVTIISAIVVICIRKRRQSCRGWDRFS